MNIVLVLSCQNAKNDGNSTNVSSTYVNDNENVQKVFVYSKDEFNNEKILETEILTNNLGFPIEKIHFENGRIYNYEKFVYDQFNNLIERYEGFSPNGLVLVYDYAKNKNQEIVHHYDTTGYLLKKEVYQNDNDGIHKRKLVYDNNDRLIETNLFDWSKQDDYEILKSVKIDQNDAVVGTRYFKYENNNLLETVLVHNRDTLEVEKNDYGSLNMPEYHLFIDYKDSTQTEIFITYLKNNLIDKQVEISKSLTQENDKGSKTEIFYEYEKQ